MDELMSIWTIDGRDQVKQLDAEILKLIGDLGGSTRRFRRERQRQLKAIVSEVYSPARVTHAARLFPSYDCIPGMAFDLTTVGPDGVAWDFDDEDRQAAAWKILEERKPPVVSSQNDRGGSEGSASRRGSA